MRSRTWTWRLGALLVPLLLMLGAHRSARAADAALSDSHAPVTNLSVQLGGTQVAINWKNPTAADWTQTTVRGALGTVAPKSETAGDAVYQGRIGNVQPTIAQGPYSLTFFADYSDGSAVPLTYTISAATAKFTISPATVVAGTSATLTGKLVDAVTGAPLS